MERSAEVSSELTARKVVIPKFVFTGVQTFDHQTEYTATTITTRWKQAPGEKDMSVNLLDGMKELGFENLSYQPAEVGDYYVVGNYTKQDTIGLWFLWDCIVLFPALFVPLPWVSTMDTQLVVSVYDGSGQLIESKKSFLDTTASGPWIWGGLVAVNKTDAAVARYAAEQAVGILEAKRNGAPPSK